ncbi:hypothetical protein PROFUN_01720 [Planoprotostelium fungivorum]|uniref:Uncharacterized protein n=1 Tax=Planoprotostelium fungivorum TaxID=1890364 RepID=A0A2P6MWC1_9EUKA|nr:hypothetical protein PROFUN_01720 [Planoprotostelium fungivorum]
MSAETPSEDDREEVASTSDEEEDRTGLTCKNKTLCYIEFLKTNENKITSEIDKLREEQRKLLEYICLIQSENKSLRETTQPSNTETTQTSPKGEDAPLTQAEKGALMAEKICQCLKNKGGCCTCKSSTSTNANDETKATATQEQLRESQAIYNQLVRNIDHNLVIASSPDVSDDEKTSDKREGPPKEASEEGLTSPDGKCIKRKRPVNLPASGGSVRCTLPDCQCTKKFPCTVRQGSTTRVE